MSETDVSQLQEKRALMRLVVEMEIKDLAAIEAVRTERRLKNLATILRASKRSPAAIMKFVRRAAPPPRRDR